MKKDLHVIDFFCGAGGFSEGFRQSGYKITLGIDNWKPAVDTHNLNHDLNDNPIDVLDFEKSIETIEATKDSEIIIGSPPCVSFSMSNKAGKADKSLGIRLIESYLRFVAVKKSKPKSILKAWLMENVPNSRNFVKENYTFRDLDLTSWAKSIKRKPDDIILYVKNNGAVLRASNYGSPQSRERFVCGEIIKSGKFPFPTTVKEDEITLGKIINKMPKPNDSQKNKIIIDPNYSSLRIKESDLSDHYYDTGVYECEWESAKFLKINHPFMGKMSFPENMTKPSRTIMATRSAGTREALIYNSANKRLGDGQYRTPTIREASTLMGFPLFYQFVGGENTKWRLIGNAVCPHLSFALATEIRKQLGLEINSKPLINFNKDILELVNNLNDGYKIKVFSKSPQKKAGAKFRRHSIKNGGITVNLMNFDPINNKKKISWNGYIYIGSGKSHKITLLSKNILDNAKIALKKSSFVKKYHKEIEPMIKSSKVMQEIYESNNLASAHNPITLINKLLVLIESTKGYEAISQHTVIKEKMIPLGQAMAIYAIGMMAIKIKQ